jgi:thiol-disulfide isomerase/thioredoxin
MKKNIASIVSIGMASGFAATTAYIVPSPGLPSSSRSSIASSRQSSTGIFFRDDDTIDVVGLELQSKMRSIVAQRTRQRRETRRPPNVKSAISLEEFATVIDEGRREGRLVVVRFHATWCKTCHAIRPSFDKAASSNPEIIFVDVPVLESNSNLHQGLGVESIPFGHIYHPEEGLVEERKLSRKTFSEFEGLMKMHSSS